MVKSKLFPLQVEILEAFFARERRFFLTGGAALAGFYLGHRQTEDLDLFTEANALSDGEATLREVAGVLGATFQPDAVYPTHRRYLLTRENESVKVDLVQDLAPQIYTEKVSIDSIRVDPPEEILTNKLCALLSRSEIRDLVDIRALEQEPGLSLERALELGSQKDGSLSPASLLYVLSGITIGVNASLPGGVSAAELRAYQKNLERRLAVLSFPK